MSDVKKLSLVLDLLSHDNYRQYNVVLAKRLGGIEYAVILNDLLDQFKYLLRTNQLVSHIDYGDELMYYTQNQAYERCGVLKDSFEKSLKIFTELGFISSIVKFGMPQKRYLKLNILGIYEWAFSNNVCRVRKSANKLAEIRQHDSGNPLHNDKENDSYNNPYKRSPYSPPPEKDKSSSFKDKEIVFDPKTYKLKNGESLKQVTAMSFLKKMKDPAQAFVIISNVHWYESQIEAGVVPNKSHEAYLQYAITKDMASKADRAWKNEMYAKLMKSEHNLIGLSILKTVVQLDKKDGSKPESIALNLPEETFSNAIDNYISTTKE